MRGPFRPNLLTQYGLLKSVSRPAGLVTIDLAGETHVVSRHRFGSNNIGKSEFPQGWNDQKIITAVLAVANDLNLKYYQQPDGMLWVLGVHDGIRIRVAFDPTTMKIITGFPN